MTSSEQRKYIQQEKAVGNGISIWMTPGAMEYFLLHPTQILPDRLMVHGV
jgi:hypothetical protein